MRGKHPEFRTTEFLLPAHMTNTAPLSKIVRALSIAFLALYWYRYILVPFAYPFIVLPTIFSPYSAFGMLLVVLFSAAHAWDALGWRHAAIFFGVSMLLTWGIEEVGVRTGLIFGQYHYTSLGPMIGSVPAEVPLLWFGLLYLGFALANAIVGNAVVLRERWTELVWLSFVGATIVTARDAVIEPILARPGVMNRPWVWEETGAYFGVPIQNFFGWMAVALAVFMAYRWFEHRHRSRPLGSQTRFIRILPVAFYVGLMVADLIGGKGPSELPVIAVFAMGLPSLMAARNILRESVAAS
ncbi:MAG: hypothetical protein RL681_348 [Candidatus Parcubacteria bacterium]|jgi:putative membrane protein